MQERCDNWWSRKVERTVSSGNFKVRGAKDRHNIGQSIRNGTNREHGKVVLTYFRTEEFPQSNTMSELKITACCGGLIQLLKGCMHGNYKLKQDGLSRLCSTSS
jgi:hypothetical protein